MPYPALYLVRQWICLPVLGGLGSDPAIDSRPAFFVSVFSALLGSTVDTSFASISGEFHFFYVDWWITDPEVDYGS